jgi:hypothetical protein
MDRDIATYKAYVAGLALWGYRWTDATGTVTAGL